MDLKLPKRTIRILVLGADGSGKSTLINNLLQEELAPENHELTTAVSNRGIVEEHIKTLNKGETDVIMYDTTAVNGDKGSLIREIQKKGGIETFDVVLFCCNAVQKVDSETWCLVTVLSDSFGRKIWDKTVFVLTFINIYLSLHSIRAHMVDEAKREALKQLATSFKENLKLQTSVATFGHFGSKTPVVLAGCDDTVSAAGSGTTSVVMKVGSGCDQLSPYSAHLIIDWKTDVWRACLRVIKCNARSPFLKVTRVQSIEEDSSIKSISREIIVGAATGAVVGTSISPGMGTILISATGAVIGGVSAVYSNKKARRAIRIVNSITLTENMCDELECEKETCTGMSSAPPVVKKIARETISAVVKLANKTAAVTEDTIINESSIGNFADEIFEHFSLSSSSSNSIMSH